MSNHITIPINWIANQIGEVKAGQSFVMAHDEGNARIEECYVIVAVDRVRGEIDCRLVNEVTNWHE